EYDNNKIGRITTSGVITEFLIPTADSGPYGICAGPNEDLWFTEFHDDKLGEVGVGDPQLDLSNLSPTSGPAWGGAAATAGAPAGARVLPAGATVIVGRRAVSGLSYFGGQAAFTVPALAPGTLNDVVLTDPSDGSFGRLLRAWLADFLDVPQAHVFHAYVES